MLHGLPDGRTDQAAELLALIDSSKSTVPRSPCKITFLMASTHIINDSYVDIRFQSGQYHIMSANFMVDLWDVFFLFKATH